MLILYLGAFLGSTVLLILYRNLEHFEADMSLSTVK